MNWFYIKRDDIRTRRILSDQQIRMMARAGELDERDLLCPEDGDQHWVRASSIPDLFIKEAPRPKKKMPKPETKPPSPQSLPTVQKKPHRSFTLIIILTAAAITIFVISKKQIPEKAKHPEQPAAPVVETNIWKNIKTDVTQLLDNDNIKQADELIESYEQEKGRDTLSLELRAKMERHLKRRKLALLYTAFVKNEASTKQTRELIDTASELGEIANLKKSLRTLLQNKKNPDADLCRSIMDIAPLINDRVLEVEALSSLKKTLNIYESEQGCMEIVKYYTSKDAFDEAVSILQKFVKNNPESPNAWFELAALLALEERKDEALSALKTAVKLGGEEASIDAKRDPRFESIKDTWTFKWNTR